MTSEHSRCVCGCNRPTNDSELYATPACRDKTLAQYTAWVAAGAPRAAGKGPLPHMIRLTRV